MGFWKPPKSIRITEAFEATAANVHAGAAHPIQLDGEALRQRDVVLLHKRNEFALSSRNARVQGTSLATMRQEERANAGISGGEITHDGCRTVCGAVVHDDELKMPIGLVQDRADGLRQIALAVIDRHHHRNERPVVVPVQADNPFPCSVAEGPHLRGVVLLADDRLQPSESVEYLRIFPESQSQETGRP